MGTKRNIQRERRRVRLVHDSVTSSASLHGVNKLGMHAYICKHPPSHQSQSMLVHKSRVCGCAAGSGWWRCLHDGSQVADTVSALQYAHSQPPLEGCNVSISLKPVEMLRFRVDVEAHKVVAIHNDVQ